MRKPPSKAAQKHEQEAVDAIQEASGVYGRRQPASGALRHYKGDGFFPNLLRFELKETGRDKIVLKLAMLRKIEREAQFSGEEPILLLRFNRLGKASIGVVHKHPRVGKFCPQELIGGRTQITVRRVDLITAPFILVFRGGPKYFLEHWEAFLGGLRDSRRGKIQ